MTDRATTLRSRFRALALGILCTGALALLPHCYDDGMDELMEMENAYVETLPLRIPDGYPVPGNGGIITVMNITSTSVRLEWQGATDDATPQENLEYRVYYATVPIPTAAAAESLGTPFNGWTTDLAGIDVTGLYGTSDSSIVVVTAVYYFTVLVRDGDLHTSNYIMVSVTPSTSAMSVYLFAEGTARQGSLSTTSDARGDIDGLCRDSETYKALGTGNVRGFIGVTATDSIMNMPVNFGVPQSWNIRSPAGRIIAANWSALFADLTYTLQALNVVSDYWWSGSLEGGAFDESNNCNGWTDNTENYQGTEGAHNDTSYPQWLSSSRRNCNTSKEVLCLSW